MKLDIKAIKKYHSSLLYLNITSTLQFEFKQSQYFVLQMYPDNNVEKCCEVFHVTSEWRKYLHVNISHLKSPQEICFCSCEIFRVKNENVSIIFSF